MGPVTGVEGDDVEMPVQEQRVTGGVLPRDPGDHIRPVAVRFQDLRLQADLGQLLRDVLRGGPFTRTGIVAGVGRVDPDQVAAQPGDLVLTIECDHVGSFGFDTACPSHPAVAPGLPASFRAGSHTDMTQAQEFANLSPPTRDDGLSCRHHVRVAE